MWTGERLARVRKPEVVLVAILFLAATLRFFALGSESLWFDEAYSVWVARHSVAWHLALSTQRIFPPLYYLCLHFWMAIGESEVIVRALSVVIGLSSVVGIYALAQYLFDRRVAWLSALLLAVSPLHIWYSQEARMYVLVAALGMASALLQLRVLREGSGWDWAAYVITSALLMNAHYFAIFLVPFQNVFAAYWLHGHRGRPRQIAKWLIGQALIGALSVVGLLGIFSSESSYWWGLLDTWHGAPGIADVLGLVYDYSLGGMIQGRLLYWGTIVLFGGCILYGVWTVLRNAETKGVAAECESTADRAAAGRRWLQVDGLLFTLLYLLVPLGIVFALSRYRSFWVLRYIFPFLPPYCILSALGLARLPRLARLLTTVLIVALSIWNVAYIYRYPQKEDWRAVVAYIESREQVGDLILLVDEDIWLPFEHYYQGEARREGISRGITDRELVAARMGALLHGYERIWLVLSHTDNWLVRDYLNTSGLVQHLDGRDWTGIRVDLYGAARSAAEAEEPRISGQLP